MRIQLGSLGFLALLLVLSPAARAEQAQASFDLGLSFFQQPTGGLIAQTGYFAHFQVEPRENWLRPVYGAQIEYTSDVNRILDGHMLAGGELIAYKANYVKPFLGVNADLGWVNFSTSANTFNSFVFGFVLSGGAEIRLTEKEKATALRVITAYRWLTGTIGGGISGGDLNSLNLSLGLTF